ncbi:hypothetical protein [Nibricoccus aquaticus]|nr:hypothetical protein [Nibricoccus aquaticus]
MLVSRPRSPLLLLLALALTLPLSAKEKDSAPAKSPDVELDQLVVTDSPPGSVPFAFVWVSNRFTGSILFPPIIAKVSPKKEKVPMWVADRRGKQREAFVWWNIPAPEIVALKNGGQILAIDGIDVTTLDNHVLRNLLMEGKAGEPVTLIIRGCGDEMNLFREITVKRISERKTKRLLDEAASRELRPARSLAELPATP